MKKYRIAYFTTEQSFALMLDVFKGFADYVDMHPNVTVCIFDCFGKAGLSAVDRGEYSIFDLPDLSAFDGILYQGSQISSKEIEQEMVKKMQESGLPVVAAEEYMEGFSFYGTDNHTALSQVIEHVIVEHQVNSCAFWLDPLTALRPGSAKKPTWTCVRGTASLPSSFPAPGMLRTAERQHVSFWSKPRICPALY